MYECTYSKYQIRKGCAPPATPPPPVVPLSVTLTRDFWPQKPRVKTAETQCHAWQVTLQNTAGRLKMAEIDNYSKYCGNDTSNVFKSKKSSWGRFWGGLWFEKCPTLVLNYENTAQMWIITEKMMSISKKKEIRTNIPPPSQPSNAPTAVSYLQSFSSL